MQITQNEPNSSVTVGAGDILLSREVCAAIWSAAIGRLQRKRIAKFAIHHTHRTRSRLQDVKT